MSAFTVASSPAQHPPLEVTGPDGLPVPVITEYLHALDTRGRSVYTQRSYALGLAHFFDWLLQHQIDPDDVTHYLIEQYIEAFAHGAKGGSCPPNRQRAGQVDPRTRATHPALERQPSIINHRLSVLSSYYAFRIARAADLGRGVWYERENPVFPSEVREQRHGMTGRDAPPRGRRHDFRRRVPHQVPSRLDPSLVEQIIDAAGSWRDKAILTLLFRTGQRIGDWHEAGGRHGVLGMTLGDLDQRGRTIIVRLKGARDEHRVPVTDDFWPVFQRYCTNERSGEASTSAAWLSFRRGHGKPLSYTAFESSLRLIGRTLGIHVHAHLLRHTLAQGVLETTGNLKVTQELLGHAHLSTTAEQYARVDEGALVEAVTAARAAFDATRDADRGDTTITTPPRYAFAYDPLTIAELEQIALPPAINREGS